MNLTLLLDSFIILLLITTVIYCYKLSKRISLLHEGKDELNSFIQDFNTAIIRAEDNIQELKKVGSSTDEILQDHIKKARFLANDLSFLMDKGEHVADNLERQIGVSRTITARPPVAAKRTNRTALPPKPTPTHTTNTQSPDEQLSLTPAEPQQPVAKNAQIEQSMTPSKKQALDDVLSAIAVRKANANNPSLSQVTENNSKTKTATKQKTTSQTNPFNKRKLNETLSAIQGE